jgi:hypothetical protein
MKKRTGELIILSSQKNVIDRLLHFYLKPDLLSDKSDYNVRF